VIHMPGWMSGSSDGSMKAIVASSVNLASGVARVGVGQHPGRLARPKPSRPTGAEAENAQPTRLLVLASGRLAGAARTLAGRPLRSSIPRPTALVAACRRKPAGPVAWIGAASNSPPPCATPARQAHKPSDCRPQPRGRHELGACSSQLPGASGKQSRESSRPAPRGTHGGIPHPPHTKSRRTS
jgi:hypothetical protein